MLAGFSISGRAGGDDKDFLYIGDAGDNTVKRFDAQTGAFIDVFVTSDSSGTQPGEPIIGPRGIIFALPEGRLANFGERGKHFHRELWLANQNANQAQNGAILRYDGFNGAFIAPLVNFTPPEKAPVAPRGIVLGNYLFVASTEGEDQSNDGKLWVYTRDGVPVIPELEAPPMVLRPSRTSILARL